MASSLFTAVEPSQAFSNILIITKGILHPLVHHSSLNPHQAPVQPTPPSHFLSSHTCLLPASHTSGAIMTCDPL